MGQQWVSRNRAGSGNLTTQEYAFDPFGNITRVTTAGTIRNTPTSAQTNRLSAAASYDGAGNLTAWNTVLFDYDGFGSLWRRRAGSAENVMVYTADDHRIWQRLPGNLNLWTLRDVDGRLLRTYVQNRATNEWTSTDDVWRDGQLVAQLGEAWKRYLQVDHLGSTRLVTAGNGNRLGYNNYYPFGEIATPGQMTVPRFTGHERNNNGASDGSADIDYMLARHHNPLTGRFLSPDQATSWRLSSPQSWNRYAYVSNSPLSYADPDGLSRRRVHAAHTRMVLEPAGLSPDAIEIVVMANVRADSGLRRIDAPQHAVHDVLSDRAANAQGQVRAQWELGRAIKHARAGRTTKSLRSLGRALHAAEDSVAHRGLGNLTLTFFQGRSGPRWTTHDDRDESIDVTDAGEVTRIRRLDIHEEIVEELSGIVAEYLDALSTEQRRRVQCLPRTADKGDCN